MGTLGAGVASIIGYVAYFWSLLIGKLLLMMVAVLIDIAQYNSFATSVVVLNGWSIVRDVANMFFILILLLIAFSTMLGIEKYDYKKHLSKLLIAAVVINFSATICGLLIDLSQVVMLTFVNGFKEAAGGNFVEALQITKFMEVNPDAGNVNQISVAISGIIYAIMFN